MGVASNALESAALDIAEAILADGRAIGAIPPGEIDDCADVALGRHGIVRTSKNFARVLSLASDYLRRARARS